MSKFWGSQKYSVTYNIIFVSPTPLTHNLNETVMLNFFSETINHRTFELGMMVVCDAGFPETHSLIPLTEVKGRQWP